MADYDLQAETNQYDWVTLMGAIRDYCEERLSDRLVDDFPDGDLFRVMEDHGEEPDETLGDYVHRICSVLATALQDRREGNPRQWDRVGQEQLRNKEEALREQRKRQAEQLRGQQGPSRRELRLQERRRRHEEAMAKLDRQIEQEAAARKRVDTGEPPVGPPSP